jgi:YVTN family beta-propeller protein
VGEGAAWVANSGSDDVTRIDTRTGRVVGSPIDVGEEPQGIAVARGSIWVCNRGSDTVTRIQP